MQIHEEMNSEVEVEKKLLNKVLPMYCGSNDVWNLILNSRLLFLSCSWVLPAWCCPNALFQSCPHSSTPWLCDQTILTVILLTMWSNMRLWILLVKLNSWQVRGGAGAEWARVKWNYSRMDGVWQQIRNYLGLSSCAVPRSAVACVVAYFRRTELLSGVSEKSGIDW